MRSCSQTVNFRLGRLFLPSVHAKVLTRASLPNYSYRHSAVQGSHSSSEMSDDQEWRKHPPYQQQAELRLPAAVKYRGSCFCGKVQFEVSADPLDAKICHCTTCQRLHGAPMQLAAIFEKRAVRFAPASLDHLGFYNSGKKLAQRELPCKVSCASCRSPIADEGRNMLLMFPTLFHYDRPTLPDEFKPSCHIFYGQRLIDVLDGKPKFEGHKDESELIPETGRKRKCPDPPPSNKL